MQLVSYRNASFTGAYHHDGVRYTTNARAAFISSRAEMLLERSVEGSFETESSA